MARRLLVLDASYSLSSIRSRGLERAVVARDLDGFFEHVWTVHPLVGAGPEDAAGGTGPPRTASIAPRHTFIEFPMGRFRMPRVLWPLNFLISQLNAFGSLRRLIRAEGISLVLVGDPYYLGLIGLALARVTRVPLAVRVNGNYDAIYAAVGRLAYPRLFRRRSVEKRIDRFVLSRADLVAAVNENNRGFAIANGTPPERTTVFRYGSLVAAVHFSPPEERNEPDLPFSGPYIVSVGRLESVKHPEDVLEAFALIEKDVPGLHCVLIGEGSMRRQIVERASELGLGDRVHVLGARSQEEIANTFARATAIASPLTGRALVEATLGARPVVAYDIEWHSELIEDRVSGILVPYRDVSAFATALRELAQDPGTADRIGEEGRRRSLAMMDPKVLAEHERMEFDRLLSRRPRDTDS